MLAMGVTSVCAPEMVSPKFIDAIAHLLRVTKYEQTTCCGRAVSDGSNFEIPMITLAMFCIVSDK